jgi:hypothetical protein
MYSNSTVLVQKCGSQRNECAARVALTFGSLHRVGERVRAPVTSETSDNGAMTSEHTSCRLTDGS